MDCFYTLIMVRFVLNESPVWELCLHYALMAAPCLVFLIRYRRGCLPLQLNPQALVGARNQQLFGQESASNLHPICTVCLVRVLVYEFAKGICTASCMSGQPDTVASQQT